MEDFDENYEKVKDCGVAWRDILVYDYYLRENAKVRPAWAPGQREHWQSITDWYAAYGSICPGLAAYAGSTYRQLLHTTHAEILSRDFMQGGQKYMVIFDYGHRDPLTGNAITWEAVEWRE